MAVFVRGWGQDRVHQFVIGVAIAGLHRPASRALRKLVTQSFHRELDVRHAQQGIHTPGIQPDRVIFRRAGTRPKAAHIADIQFPGLPGLQSFLDLLGKLLRVRRRAECLFGQNGGSLVMSVPVALGSGEARNQHVGPKGSDHAHHVAEGDVVSAPFLEGFFGTFRIAEIRHPAEALFHSVVAIGSSQFQCAQHAQHVKQVAAHFVLTAFAAGESHQQRRVSLAAGLEGQHASVLVVGMRGGLHQAGRSLQPEQHLFQARCPGVRGQRIDWTRRA